jgi:hypothetical protein
MLLQPLFDAVAVLVVSGVVGSHTKSADESITMPHCSTSLLVLVRSQAASGAAAASSSHDANVGVIDNIREPHERDDSNKWPHRSSCCCCCCCCCCSLTCAQTSTATTKLPVIYDRSYDHEYNRATASSLSNMPVPYRVSSMVCIKQLVRN